MYKQIAKRSFPSLFIGITIAAGLLTSGCLNNSPVVPVKKAVNLPVPEPTNEPPTQVRPYSAAEKKAALANIGHGIETGRMSFMFRSGDVLIENLPAAEYLPAELKSLVAAKAITKQQAIAYQNRFNKAEAERPNRLRIHLPQSNL